MPAFEEEALDLPMPKPSLEELARSLQNEALSLQSQSYQRQLYMVSAI